MKIGKRLTGWLIAAAMLTLRYTCRIRLHNDPRPGLRASSKRYVYSLLHAHQVAAAIDGEPGTAAMVSRSGDGELIVAGLRAMGVTVVRGSNRGNHGDKGGRGALDALSNHVRGGQPAYLAVDGPRGPRNRVRKGIAVLSRDTGAAVLNIVAVPRKRWILSKTWDRLQIPHPFARIDAYFGEPIWPRDDEDIETYRRRIELDLNQLESAWDPTEGVRKAA